MKSEVEKLIGAYEDERLFLERGNLSAQQKLRLLNQHRKATATSVLIDLLPDLSMRTIRILASLVPSFTVATIPTWLGLVRRVDPSVNLDLLRIQLGHHLDSLGFNAPSIWHQLVTVAFDVPIQDFQLSISAATEAIVTIDRRTAALKQLLADKKSLTDKKIQKAVRVQRESGVRSSLSKKRQDDTDDENDLLTTWLWYEILTPDVSQTDLTSHEDPVFAPGGGDFGGGGTSGSWSDDAVPESTSGQDDLTHHAGLGSESFS